MALDFALPILAVLTFLIIGIVGFMLIRGRQGSRGSGSRDKMYKDAEKRLAQDPKNAEALITVGDIHFREETWDQAFKAYSTLLELDIHGLNLSEFDINYRYGLAAMKLGMTDDAFRGFVNARNIKQDNFEVNYNLGNLEFQRKNYEKAIALLNQARVLNPDDAPTLRTLGHSYFRVKKNKEAMTYIRKSIDLAPDDKESLFTLAECYYEANQTEQALRIFGHLRGDPVLGANSCLISGSIHVQSRHYDKAIADFELGLRHENIKADIRLELRYRLATSYLRQNEIGKALGHLREINLENPNYKDVVPLIGKYQELNANKNLQIYLMAPSGDFVALCRKIVISYYQRAKVKISNISLNKNEWADILAEVDTAKWSDVIMFRFIRTQGSVGELVIRDFHSHLKDAKAGKGICVAVGNFSEEARRYTEARLIDLIEKDRLQAILNSVDAKVAQASSKK